MTDRALKTRVGWAVPTVLVVLLIAAPGDRARAADGPRFTRTEVTVAVPDVQVIDQNGTVHAFPDLMSADTPVFVEFIFATCTTICPVLSAGYASIQRKLGDDLDEVHLLSITIDPENDGPEELTHYLERYGARPGWDFVTGTREDINAIMRAFDAYVPDKMSHRPLIFIRSPVDGSWVRLFGFASSKDLMAEFERARGPAEAAEVEQ